MLLLQAETLSGDKNIVDYPNMTGGTLLGGDSGGIRSGEEEIWTVQDGEKGAI